MEVNTWQMLYHSCQNYFRDWWFILMPQRFQYLPRLASQHLLSLLFWDIVSEEGGLVELIQWKCFLLTISCWHHIVVLLSTSSPAPEPTDLSTCQIFTVITIDDRLLSVSAVTTVVRLKVAVKLAPGQTIGFNRTKWQSAVRVCGGIIPSPHWNLLQDTTPSLKIFLFPPLKVSFLVDWEDGIQESRMFNLTYAIYFYCSPSAKDYSLQCCFL